MPTFSLPAPKIPQLFEVPFCEEPRQEEYGTVVVFEDLYGNRWDLYQNK